MSIRSAGEMVLVRMTRSVPRLLRLARTSAHRANHLPLAPVCSRCVHRGPFGGSDPFAKMEDFMRDMERKFKRDIEDTVSAITKEVSSNVNFIVLCISVILYMCISLFFKLDQLYIWYVCVGDKIDVENTKLLIYPFLLFHLFFLFHKVMSHHCSFLSFFYSVFWSSSPLSFTVFATSFSFTSLL